ncbi:hypothetical protein AAG570_002789 [Ranatra chinensis]|uniref:Galactosylceramide sulfotransferase n=1 Tax=Ranatra chinensis TaxID=642074 RepID=A0ABD0YMW2_9HEMI
MRFGYRRGLDFVLPSTNNYLGNPQHFVETMVPQELASPDGRYSIFTHHTRYNRTAVRRVMRPGAKFVTILRDPPDLFESLFSYYHLDKALGQLTLDKLLEDPDNTMLLQRRFSKRIGFNQMSWDLGVEPEDFNDEKKIDALLRTVEEDFDLVMISEHFPTSLVLLADMMGWPLTDVAYFSLNSRPNRAKLRLTEAQRATLAHLNAADSRLYEYFYAKFRKRVFNYGPERMTRDVQELLLLNSRLMSRCLYKKKVGYGQTMALESVGVSDDFDCRYAVKEELQFTEEIRSSQRSRMAQLNRLRALLSNQTADPGR